MLLLKKDNLTIIMDDGGKFQWEEKFNQGFYKYVVSFTVLVNGKMKTFSRAMFVRVKDTYSRVQDGAGENVNTIKDAISDAQENVGAIKNLDDFMGVFDTLHSLGYDVYPNSVDETDMEFVPLKDGDFQPAAILGLITLNLRITHQINKDDEEDTEEARAKVYKCTCGAQGDWSYFCNDCPKCGKAGVKENFKTIN